MKSYKLSTANFSTTVQLSLDFLQGLYSAQLLAGLVSIEDESYSQEVYTLNQDTRTLHDVGLIPYEDKYPFELTLLEAPDRPELALVRTEVIKDPEGDFTYSYLPPDSYRSAYDIFLSNPLVFNPVYLTGKGINWDMEKTPYPAIANFDQSGAIYGDEEALIDWVRSGGKSDKLFSQSRVAGRYFIGTSSSARNTFMLRASSNDNQQQLHEYMKGFYSFYKWLRDEKTIQNIPKFYLYDYEREVMLNSVNTEQDMLAQLPKRVIDINM